MDALVVDIFDNSDGLVDLTTSVKSRLLSIPTIDVVIDGCRSPLMNGVGRTTYSLYKCFSGESRKLVYPSFNI